MFYISLPTIIVLGTAASIGSWLGFSARRWLAILKWSKRWMAQLPEQYHHKASNDLFPSRPVRTINWLFYRFLYWYITTDLAGLFELQQRRFQLFNWISGFMGRSYCLIRLYILNLIPLFKKT